MKLRNIKPFALSWVVTEILLMIATWYNVLTRGELGVVGVIFSSSLVVYFITFLISKRGD